MDPALLSERLETACHTFDTLERQLADPALAADPKRLQSIARERARLEPLVLDHQQLCKLQQEQRQSRSLLKEHRDDPAMAELVELAVHDLESLEQRINALLQSLTLALLPSDPRDERSVMLEIRAGAGGDEASL
jgi:peptide chain release factor 1